ncbi:hypothetical protein FDP41_000728 [Naegleria fowleri]|uniref:Uncharacterized protein n=1 Tax=Naegleria fowleri TaxID=5763 RepID=A0A6A5CHQ8_NAEFO|nr:uncharacterized protein FDP41_000728 [Naegleria fowleri]KAF0984829.1 hypothetical protein FDP41_000728 [Naegleria fowleri]CAG4714734.1 unnamed protein product [Naegleria fowleri]
MVRKRRKGGLTSFSGVPPSDMLKREREYREFRSDLIEKKRKFGTCNPCEDDHYDLSLSALSIPFVDISMKFDKADEKTTIGNHDRSSNRSTTDDGCDKDQCLTRWLMDQLNTHFCNDLCFERVPQVNFSNVFSPELSIELSHIDDCSLRRGGISICDEKCDETT